MRTRRSFIGAGAALALAACGRDAPSEAASDLAWSPPPGAFGHPGFQLWGAPIENLAAPLDAPLLTESGTQTLAALLDGRPALLSFWAPWCAPCLAEKPSLDFLAGRLAEARANIAVLSILAFVHDEERTLETATANAGGLEHLASLVDASPQATTPFRAYVGAVPGEALRVGGANPSLPCSTLIGADGAELARLAGAIEYIPPAALTPAELGAANPETVMRTWPKRELWREDAMFEFLLALGG